MTDATLFGNVPIGGFFRSGGRLMLRSTDIELPSERFLFNAIDVDPTPARSSLLYYFSSSDTVQTIHPAGLRLLHHTLHQDRKPFAELNIGDVFYYRGLAYQKTSPYEAFPAGDVLPAEIEEEVAYRFEFNEPVRPIRANANYSAEVIQLFS